jgi:hypothetical protein
VADRFHVKAQNEDFLVLHGDGYSGHNGHKECARDNMMNVVIGHLHSHAGVNHVTTTAGKVWAVNGGCLIDVSQYCFDYAKHSRFKPTLGVTVVLDGGRVPIWIPLE